MKDEKVCEMLIHWKHMSLVLGSTCLIWGHTGSQIHYGVWVALVIVNRPLAIVCRVAMVVCQIPIKNQLLIIIIVFISSRCSSLNKDLYMTID